MKRIFYKQLDSMDCGAASLKIIAECYGKKFSQQHLRDLCHISRNGVSLLGISDAAEAVGFRTLGVKITWEQLVNDVIFPCIIHWNQRHFIVVLGLKKRRNRILVIVSDPSIGILEYSEEQFKKSWIQIKDNLGDLRGVALLLSPKPEFYSTDVNEEKNVKLLDLFHYLRPYLKYVSRIAGAMLLASLFSLLLPYLTQSMVDTGIENRDIGFIITVLIAQLLLIIGQMTNNIIRSWLMLHVTTRIGITYISDFIGKMMRLSISFFDSKNIGDILQRIKDFNRVQTFLTGSLISTAMSIISFVIYSIIMGVYNGMILSVFLIGSLLYVFWIQVFMRHRRKLDYMLFQELSSNQNNLIQLVDGMQEIKLNNCERMKRWEWEDIQARLFRINSRSLILQQVQNIGGGLVDQIKNISISFLSAYNVINGRMTIGEMMALQYIIGQLNAPLRQFIEFIQSLQDAKISIERMGEISNQKDEENPHNCNSIIPTNANISLRNIVFQYDGPRSAKVLNNLSLTIPAGKITAIVGMSGSGKTTLLKIILGFYSPASGEIFLGKHKLSTYSVSKWRRNCGVVMQDGFIFNDTILNNIGVSDERIDIERVHKAAEKACINNFIESLPAAYNTRIGTEGHGLSAGQKQRLLIARAIYKDAKYIFLDEATNSLDANNEKDIMNNLNKFFHGRTVVIVAHRLSTVKNADNIVVLGKGCILEQGNHNELLSRHGIYYNLIKNQLNIGA